MTTTHKTASTPSKLNQLPLKLKLSKDRFNDVNFHILSNVDWPIALVYGSRGKDDKLMAEYMIRAVNSHAAMLEALENTLLAFEDRYDGAPDAHMQWMGNLMHEIKAAIWQAKGGGR